LITWHNHEIVYAEDYAFGSPTVDSRGAIAFTADCRELSLLIIEHDMDVVSSLADNRPILIPPLAMMC
jgi:hypothetical protein